MPGNIRDADSIPGLGLSSGGEMASHSTILVWRIPWTEEPGCLEFIGWQKVGHDKSDLAQHAKEVFRKLLQFH